MGSIRPLIVCTHAGFDEMRHLSLMRVLQELRWEAPQIPFKVMEDRERRGSLWCWRKAMELGLEDEHTTHVVWLPDDAILCKDFGKILLACIECRPNDVFDCFVNHPKASEIETLWYTTLDGYVGLGGVMPRALLQEHLAWRDAHPELASTANDAGVNLWAMATRRPIYKTAYSLVTHDHRMTSLDGHSNQEGHERKGLHPVGELRTGVASDISNFLGRTYAAPDERARMSCVPLGRTYWSNHLPLVTQMQPPDRRAYWWAEREGLHISKKPKVYIVIPNQGSIKADVTQCIVAEMNHLLMQGVEAVLNIRVRDSLITRSRDRAVAHFMASDCTHLLFWDSDIIPTEVGFVRKMLSAYLPLVAGAAPFKNDTGHVVCVLDEAHQREDGRFEMPMACGCVEVKCAGTGIMLIERKVIDRLCEAHQDKMYVSHVPGVVHRAEWALFQDCVRDMDRLSEDWEFCARWRDLGGKVYVQPDLVFEHIGERAYTGSFNGQHGG